MIAAARCALRTFLVCEILVGAGTIAPAPLSHGAEIASIGHAWAQNEAITRLVGPPESLIGKAPVYPQDFLASQEGIVSSNSVFCEWPKRIRGSALNYWPNDSRTTLVCDLVARVVWREIVPVKRNILAIVPLNPEVMIVILHMKSRIMTRVNIKNNVTKLISSFCGNRSLQKSSKWIEPCAVSAFDESGFDLRRVGESLCARPAGFHFVQLPLRNVQLLFTGVFGGFISVISPLERGDSIQMLGVSCVVGVSHGFMGCKHQEVGLSRSDGRGEESEDENYEVHVVEPISLALFLFGTTLGVAGIFAVFWGSNRRRPALWHGIEITLMTAGFVIGWQSDSLARYLEPGQQNSVGLTLKYRPNLPLPFPTPQDMRERISPQMFHV